MELHESPSFESSIYFDKNSILKPCDIDPIVCGLRELISERRFDVIDTILSCIEINKVHTDILICFLKVTGKFRKNIITWNVFKNIVEIELTERGENMSRKLWGIPGIKYIPK